MTMQRCPLVRRSWVSGADLGAALPSKVELNAPPGAWVGARIALVLCLLVCASWAATAQTTLRVIANGDFDADPDTYATVSGAWAEALSRTGDFLLQIEYSGPVAGDFVEPMMELGEIGDIQITALPGLLPSIYADDDHPVFRNSGSRELRISGVSATDRLGLVTEYPSPVVDCGDATSTGLVIIENAYIIKEPGPDDPPTNDGVLMQIDNRAVAQHQLTNVDFVGGHSDNQNMAALLTGPRYADTIMDLALENVDFSNALGTGPRMRIENLASVVARDCVFESSGSGVHAPAVQTSAIANGGVPVTLSFHDCEFMSGNRNLFELTGDNSDCEYVLYRPVFTGKCGNRAFDIGTTGATVKVLGLDDADQPQVVSGDVVRVDMDPMVTAGTSAYALLRKGRIVFDHVTGSVKPIGGGVSSGGSDLQGDVEVEMYSCEWVNGAGVYRCDATGGAFAPQLVIKDTLYRGGGVDAYIDTSGFDDIETHTGQATVALEHVTLTGPVDDVLIRGNTGDEIVAKATLFDAQQAGDPNEANASNLELKNDAVVWTNLAYDPDDPAGKAGFSDLPNTGVVVANPWLDGSGKLTHASTAALAGAVGSNKLFDIEEEPRPQPDYAPLGWSRRDIGADEAQFPPSAIFLFPVSVTIGDDALDNDFVATVSSLDPDPGDAERSTFVLVPGQDGGGRFQIVGDELQVADASLLDALIQSSHPIRVRVTDTGGFAIEQDFVVQVTDETPPFLVTDGVVMTAHHVAEVTFSEPMGPGVLNPANYLLSGAGRGTLTEQPSTVELVAGNTYRLTWAGGEMMTGGPVTITVSNVTDIAGNGLVPPGSGTDPMGGMGGTAPRLVLVAVQTDQILYATFNEYMDSATATNPANYTLSGSGIGTAAPQPDTVTLVVGAPTTYALQWNTGAMDLSEGLQVTLTVLGATDLAGNPVSTAAGNNEKSYDMGTVAPWLDSVQTMSDHEIQVTFSEVLGTGALDPANYSISDFPGNPGTGTLGTGNPSTVSLVEAATYLLTWNSGEMLDGGVIRVTVQDVRDLLDIVLDPNPSSRDTLAVGTPPTLLEAWVVDSKNIKVRFSEEMAPGMIAPMRYTLSIPGPGVPADWGMDDHPDGVTDLGATTFLLTWDTGALEDGADITITVSTGEDLAGNPLDPAANSATVTDRIAVTSGPGTAYRYAGEPHSMTVDITGGAGPITYQWIKMVGKDMGPTDGPTLNFSSLEVTDSGLYYCNISDGREEVVDSNPASLFVAAPLSIVQEPLGGAVDAEESFSFSVQASGGHLPRSYQWKHDGQNVGLNSSIYAIDSVLMAHAGGYWVEVTDEQDDAVMSQTVVLDVVPQMPVGGRGLVALLAGCVGLIGAVVTRRKA